MGKSELRQRDEPLKLIHSQNPLKGNAERALQI